MIAVWRRFVRLLLRAPAAAPAPDRHRYGFDERLRWHPPPGLAREPSWLGRTERDSLRRDARSYLDDAR